MTDRSLTWLSYPVVMVLLVVLTVGLIVFGWFLRWGLASLYLLAIPLVLAVVYLAWYRTLPYHPPETRASAGVIPPDTEPFEDPVEEADRLDEAKESEESSEELEDEDDLDVLGDLKEPPSEDPDLP